MNSLHILTVPNGKHVLVGERLDAIKFARNYGNEWDVLDSNTLASTHFVEIQWLIENEIKKVIYL